MPLDFSRCWLTRPNKWYGDSFQSLQQNCLFKTTFPIFQLLILISAAGSWPEIEYAHATRFSKLMEFYQDVVLVEKQEKQDYSRRMTPKKHKFASLTVQTPILSVII